MQKRPLVTVMTPCHNSGKFLFRLMDSILGQTYPNIEMITVDNDSQDDTAEVIKSYIPKFEKKGYSLTYIKEDDLGPSWAVNNALPFMNGEFIYMPDSDDWLGDLDAIEKIVNKFEELPEDYAIVRCYGQQILETDMSKLRVFGKGQPAISDGNLFEDCLFAKNGFFYCGVCYAYKMSAVREIIGTSIFAAYNIGQNRQMMLPLLYSRKCYTIQEPLANYLVRANSICHGEYAKYGVMKEMHKTEEIYIDAILATIKEMSKEQRDFYKSKFLQMGALNMYEMARKKSPDDMQNYKEEYIQYGGSILHFKYVFMKKDITAWIFEMLVKLRGFILGRKD